MLARPHRSRSTTPPDAAFWAVATAFAVTMLGTTLPTPLYVYYQREIGFSTLMTTVIFSAYAAGVITALLLVGQASDVIGRRMTLIPGLLLAAMSGAVFLVAHDLDLLLLARFLSGLSAGIFTGTATATLVDLARDRHRATLVATLANMGGLGFGPLLAGMIAQFTDAGLQAPYVVHLALLALVASGIWRMPEPVPVRSPREIRPTRLSVPSAIRALFVRAAMAGFAGFAVLGLFTAVVPTLLRVLLGAPGPAVAGMVVCGLFAASLFGQLVLFEPLRGRAMPAGCALLSMGAIVLAAGIATGSLLMLLVAVALAGVGQGISFRAALGSLNAAAPPARRAEVTSTFFLIAYLAISVPVIGVGAAAQVVGLQRAGVAFGVAIAVLAAAAAVSVLMARMPLPATRGDEPQGEASL